MGFDFRSPALQLSNAALSWKGPFTVSEILELLRGQGVLIGRFETEVMMGHLQEDGLLQGTGSGYETTVENRRTR